MFNLLDLKFLQKNIVVALTISFFIVGVSFAWNAVWHGTNWTISNKVISPQNLSENFQYLYERVPDPQLSTNNNCSNGDILVYNKNTQKFNCLSCIGSGATGLKFSSNGAQCAQANSMCRIWYRISSTAGWSNWVKTPWFYFNNGSSWVQGPVASSPNGSGGPIKVQMKTECNNAPAQYKTTYKINVNQWTGVSINDITTTAGNTSYISTGISEGTITNSVTTLTANNAVFASLFNSSSQPTCHLQYRIAGNSTNWSLWKSDGEIAFTGTSNGNTNLSNMTNVALQIKLCCGTSCF